MLADTDAGSLITAWLTMLITAGGLIAIVVTGSYRSVERVAVCLGLFELVFILVAWYAHPDGATILAGMVQPELGNSKYVYLLVALGMSGAALVAAIVVSLTAAWGVGEMFGFKRSLQHHPREAPWFYAIFVGAVTLAAVVVASENFNLVAISVAVQVMNALLLPIVLGFLFALG